VVITPSGVTTPLGVVVGLVFVAVAVVVVIVGAVGHEWLLHRRRKPDPHASPLTGGHHPGRRLDWQRILWPTVVFVPMVGAGWYLVLDRSAGALPLDEAKRTVEVHDATSSADLRNLRVVSDVRIDPLDEDTIRVNYLGGDQQDCRLHYRIDVKQSAQSVTVTVVVGDAVDSFLELEEEQVDLCTLGVFEDPALPGYQGVPIHRCQDFDLRIPNGQRELIVGRELPSDLGSVITRCRDRRRGLR